MCVSTAAIYIRCSRTIWGCLPSSSLLPSVLPRRESLDSTNYPIESIALSCGYSDALVFTKGLSRYEGNVPFEIPQGKPQGEHKRTAQEVEGLIARLLEAIDETKN